MEKSEWSDETQVLPAAYPLVLTIREDKRFSRGQLAIRLALAAVVVALFKPLSVLAVLVYIGLPLWGAVSIARHGARYALLRGQPIKRWLERFLGVGAYLLLISDQFPRDPNQRAVRITFHPGAVPTPMGALLRVLLSLPQAVILVVIGAASTVVWCAAMLMVLASGRYPQTLHKVQVGVLAFAARLLAYHLSLVEAYPPFSLQANHFGSLRP